MARRATHPGVRASSHSLGADAAKRKPRGQPPPRIGLRTTLVPDQLRRMIDTVPIRAEGGVITGRPRRGEQIAGKHKHDKRMKGQR